MKKISPGVAGFHVSTLVPVWAAMLLLGMSVGLISSARAEFIPVVWGNALNGKTNLPPAATNLTAVSAGNDHTLALRADGAVIAWGMNSSGQTNVPVAATNVVQISAGQRHNLVLREDGSLVAWGINPGGITNIPAAATNQPVAGIAAGASHNLVLRTDGTTYAWGNPTAGITNVPARATGGMRIAANRFHFTGHNLFLRRDGTVVGWGVGSSGQTNPPPQATNLIAVAAGMDFSLGLKADGTVIGWGGNSSGQISIPLSATNVVAIAAGLSHVLALRADGSIVGWGSNNFDKRTVPASVSNAVAVAITAGAEHSGCLIGDGMLQFVDQLGDLVAYHNQAFHLNALAVGAPPLSYRWFFNDAEIPGDNAGVLTLSSVQFTNAGAYTVVVSNALGVITGLVANLSVEIQPTLPLVTTAPESQSAIAGSNVTFSVIAEGHPTPTYQWQFGITNISGATNASYTLPYVLTNHAGNYRVVISNSIGVITSSVASLTVNLPQWPTLNSWPASRAVSYGSPVTLSVATTANEGPVFYTWQLNGTNLPNVGGANLMFNAFTPGDGGIYRVAVSNAFGGSMSPEFEIAAVPVATWGSGTVTNLPRSLTNAIALSVGAQHAMALKADGQLAAWGDNFFVTGNFPNWVTNNYGMASVPPSATNVVAIASGTYHNLAVRGDGTVVAWGRNTGGETNVSSSVTNVIAVAAGDSHSLALRADGTLISWGTNSTGQIDIPLAATNIVAIAAGSSHSVALRSDGKILVWGIPTPSITTVPNVTNVVGISARANYTVAIQADGKRVVWGSNVPTWKPFNSSVSPLVGDVQISAASGFNHVVYSTPFGIQILYAIGALNGTEALLLPPAWLQNVVAVAAGNVSFALMQPADGLPLRQTEQRRTYLGSPAVFSAHVEGQRAMGIFNNGRYQWRFNGNDLPGETNRALVISTAAEFHSGDYSVVLSNFSESVTSQISSLMVSTPAVPQLLQDPISQTAGAGSSVSFNAFLAYGTPGQFQWTFNHQPIPGATRDGLLLTNVQANAAGEYRVVVTNYSGSITSLPASLIVTATPPTVVSSPASRRVALGLPAFFVVGAAGTEPMSYQWYLNNGELLNATNTAFYIPATESSDLGNYTVVISNSSGSITSNPALLSTVAVGVWGNNNSLAETIPIAATNLIALAAGDAHALALRADGIVIGWGENSCGQITIPSSATNVVRVAASALHSVALRDDGQVLVWGQSSGGLGTLPTGLSNVVEIAAGLLHNLALRGDGSVVVWGLDWSGNRITPPENTTNVVALASGAFHSLALRADGTAVGWGNNNEGQISIPLEATNLIALTAGFNFSAALRADGSVLAWGRLGPSSNLTASYSCGGYSISSRNSPSTNGLIALPASATNIVALAAGKDHLLMLRADGQLISWGNNDFGQSNFGSVTNVIGIAAGGNQSLALTGEPTLRLGGLRTNRIAGIGDPMLFNPAMAGMPPLRSWQWILPDGESAPMRSHFFTPATTANDQGEFQFILTNAFGAFTGHISLTLTVAPPRVVTHPAPQFVAAGSNVSFTVIAAGSPSLTYRWQRNEINLNDNAKVIGATTPNLTLLNVAVADTASYRVVVTNTQGSVSSSNATMVVFPAEPLAVALDAEDLVWTTSGPGGWHWQTAVTHDGVDAAETGPYLEDQTNWVETTVIGPTTVSFWWRSLGWLTDRFSFSIDGVERISIANDFEWQQRSYYIPAGSHTLRWTHDCEPFAGTSAAWLDQVVFTNAVLPTITTQPTSRTTTVGANTTFNSTVSGTEPFFYQWRFNDVNIPSATNGSLTLSKVQDLNAGNYQIIITNLVGSVTSQVAVLTVNGSAPVIQFTNTSVTAAPGTTPTFNSTILGTAPMNIVWQRNQQNLPNATNASLVLSNVQPGEAGNYRVVAGNELGTAFGMEAQLVIVPVATWGGGNSVLPVRQDVGDVVGLAGGASHSVALRRDGTATYWGNYSSLPFIPFTSLIGSSQLVSVAAANHHDLGLRSDGTVIVFGESTTFDLDKIPASVTNVVAIATSGRHDLALRADGSVVSWGDSSPGLSVPLDATNLVAISAAVGYSLGVRDTGELLAWGDNSFGQLELPVSNDFVAIAAGFRHAVALRANGTVAAWGNNEFGQTNVPPGLSNVVALATQLHHTLALRSDGKVFAWGRNDSGQTNIWPTLANVVGIAAGRSHSLALVGDGRPVINLLPQRRRIASGTNTLLNVFATGAGPLHYQWRHDGINISGATNASLLVSTGGNYSVVISNQLGSVVSPVSTVNVIPPALRFDTAAGAVSMAEDGLHLRVLGASGQGSIVLLASTNLTDWTPISTNPPVVGAVTCVDVMAMNFGKRFYRVVEIESTVVPLVQLVSPVFAATPTGGWFRATLTGLSGSGPVTIFGSSNLVDWLPIATNEPVIGEWDFEHVQPDSAKFFWYRAVEQR